MDDEPTVAKPNNGHSRLEACASKRNLIGQQPDRPRNVCLDVHVYRVVGPEGVGEALLLRNRNEGRPLPLRADMLCGTFSPPLACSPDMVKMYSDHAYFQLHLRDVILDQVDGFVGLALRLADFGLGGRTLWL